MSLLAVMLILIAAEMSINYLLLEELQESLDLALQEGDREDSPHVEALRRLISHVENGTELDEPDAYHLKLIIKRLEPGAVSYHDSILAFNKAVEYWRVYLEQEDSEKEIRNLLMASDNLMYVKTEGPALAAYPSHNRLDSFWSEIKSRTRFGPVKYSKDRFALIYQKSPGSPCRIVYIEYWGFYTVPWSTQLV